MYKTLTIKNSQTSPIYVISEVSEFNKKVIHPKSEITFAAELDPDLKIFSRKVRRNKRDYLWVGIIDIDADI